MGRVPALRAEATLVYFILDKTRKTKTKRDALATLESKMVFFCTKANLRVRMEEDAYANVPQLPINELRVEKEDEKVDYNDDDCDAELMHWYNSENNIREDIFQHQVVGGS